MLGLSERCSADTNRASAQTALVPAPFRPRKPVTMPGWTTKSSPSTASFSPYRLLRFSTSIIAWSLHRYRRSLRHATHARNHPPGPASAKRPQAEQATYAARPTAHRPPAYPGLARREAGTKATGHVLQHPQARGQENARPSAAFQPAGTAPATSPRQYRERAGRLLKDSFTTGRPRAMWGRRSRLRLEAPRGHGYLAAGCVIIHRGRIFPGIRGIGG